MARKFLLFFCFFIASCSLSAQNFDLRLFERQVKIKKKEYPSLAIQLQEDHRDVKNSLYRYLQQYGFVQNKLGYYIYHPNNKKKDGERISSIKVTVSLERKKKEGITIIHAIPSAQGLTKKETKTFLLDYKVKFYGNQVQQKIRELENKQVSISQKQNALRLKLDRKPDDKVLKSQRKELLTQFDTLEKKIDEWKHKLLKLQ